MGQEMWLNRSIYVAGCCLLIVLGLPGLTLTAAADPDLTPRVVYTKYLTEDVVVALTELHPPASPEEDAAPYIQQAIDRVAEAGGGVVFLHLGEYRLDSPITVREAVTLRGDWTPPPVVEGTLLAVRHGRGDAEGAPAITLERGSGFREISVWYPEQDPEAIAPYPWTFRTCTDYIGNNHTVMNVTLVNPYQAFQTGPEFNELHTLRNVHATPLKTGLRIDMTTDIGRLIHLRFNPDVWISSGLPGAPTSDSAQEALHTQLRDAVGIDMGRSDWEYIYDVEVRGYGVGMRIRQGQDGGANAVMFASHFTEGVIGLELVAMNNMGLAATGSSFSGSRYGLHGAPQFSNVAQFNSCDFAGGEAAVHLAGNAMLSFQHGRFKAPVHAEGGGISVLNADFDFAAGEDAAPAHLSIGEEVGFSRILGNRFSGEPVINNAMRGGDAMVSHEAIPQVRPTVLKPNYSMPHPRPASFYLVNVMDYGADHEQLDNTAAFQAALDALADIGGTVYVPAGIYGFEGSLRVPSGVELRGCFDVPHHTVSGGSMLMPLAGRGDAEGPPFIELESGSGLRGLTIWYPEQGYTAEDIVSYPWAVRSLGPDCWVMDITLAPAYQGVDFATHPNDGHMVRYLAGAFLRRALQVGQVDTQGWVEDCQFNPHYAFRLHETLTQPNHGIFGEFIAYQREHLEGMRFGRSAFQHIYRNFLYGAYDGLAFRDEDGGAHAHVVMQGVDTVSRSLFLEKTAPEGVELINSQLVPLSDWEVGAIVSDPVFDGKAWLFNNQVWAGTTTGLIEGTGDIVIQQLNTLSGELFLEGGRIWLENAFFQLPLTPHIDLGPEVNFARLLANAASAGRLDYRADPALSDSQLRYLANSSARRPAEISEEGMWFEADWRDATPQAAMNGGVADVECVLHSIETASGNPALRLAGTATSEEHAFQYFALMEANIPVASDSILQYHFHPTNERSRNIAIDLLFTDGSTLRDSDTPGAHPANPRGVVGEWSQIRHEIGRDHAGKEVFLIWVAYDSQKGVGDFEAFLADLSVGSEGITQAYQVQVAPTGGVYDAPLTLRLHSDTSHTIRYTLDGSNPTSDSPRHDGPIVLSCPGLHELRYTLDAPDMQTIIFSELYTVE